MELKKLDAQNFRAMVAVGQQRLEKNVDYVNSLNVFPVPDGDTGTNMNLSFSSGAQAVKDSSSEKIGELAQSLAKGLLMGARGNSGVILSQLFRGFSQSLKGKEELTAEEFASAFRYGVETAYKAVMKPVEGTILTVARESAKAGERKSKETDDIVEVMKTVVKSAHKALEKTPDLLPILKEVGVVDSGGQGLLYIYEGFLSVLSGEDFSLEDLASEKNLDEMVRAEHHRNVSSHINTEDITYGYCTEIMVRLNEGETVDSQFDYEEFRNYLDGLGDSLLVVADDEIVKVHVHTERPGEVMNYGQKFGSLMKIKVDNMREQHSSLMDNDGEKQVKELKEYGVIAVSSGEGIKKLFESVGVDYVISGGQTMNPSTEDFLKAMKSVPAKHYILLPNNKNILMAAEQAAIVSETPTVVVPTKTIPEGLTAMLGYNPTNELESNKDAMISEIEQVITGQVTYAIRDTEIDGIKIKKDDYMGIINGSIKLAEANLFEAALATVGMMLEEDSEILTILIGDDGSQEEAERLANQIEKNHEDLEIEIHEGNQPVYPYLFSVE
ncbi:DAK2 domain-containing protein [Lacticigenium naphthae]|uniref:DAK2 domain-containing protein n=1 Tax=Lacticigenium naphthae TaxID=515351 RepID=UPI0004034A90|nr:DAK2 domain-containing protein [Lacticigenium naphthae]